MRVHTERDVLPVSVPRVDLRPGGFADPGDKDRYVYFDYHTGNVTDVTCVLFTFTGGVENFVVADNGLKPIRVATWGPFVMLNLNASGDDDDDDVSSSDDDVSSIPGPGEWMGNDVSARISTSWFDDPR